MPKKVRELIRNLMQAGWQLERGGKGSHRKFGHAAVLRKVILSGRDGEDAQRYQEKDVQRAVDEANEAE